MSRRAFTLVEMAVTLAVTGLLTVALGAALSAASRVAPKDSSTPTVRTSGRVLERLASELAFAQAFTVLGSDQVTFTVADRDGDDTQEKMLIALSDPDAAGRRSVTLSMNGADPEPLGVASLFALSYATATVTEAVPAGSSTTESTLLRVGQSGAEDTPISATYSVGQAFLPALPDSATSWAITRIVVALGQSGAVDGSVTLSIQRRNASGLPAGIHLDKVVISESELRDKTLPFEWILSSPISFGPTEGACIVLAHTSGAISAETLVTPGSPSRNAAFLFSADGGATFKADEGLALSGGVFGTVTAPANSTVSRTYLDAINIRFRAGNGAASSATTTVRVLNRPEIDP
ncbi:MAG: prepilin-type N-terminal cleavage/methylation domain-containing protein [Phycisphaerales bacterium]